MSDRRHGHVPAAGDSGRIARFALVVVGLLGFVVFPGSWPLPAGPGIGMRTGATPAPPAHQAVGRGRAAAGTPGTAATKPASPQAETRHAIAAPHQETSPTADPALPASGASPPAPGHRQILPPTPREPAPAGAEPPVFRGRAPPAATGH